MLRIVTVLNFILLDEAFNEIVKIIVESANLVFHVFLEGNSSDLNLVD